MKHYPVIVLCAALLSLFAATALAQSSPPQELVDAAKKGDPVNEWALGHYYLTNTADKKQAYYWLKKAADAGQMNAKIELQANFNGDGPPASNPFGDAQTAGIVKRAAEAKAIVKADAPDTRLTMFRADNDSAPQYIFYSPMKQQQVTITDRNGTLVATPPTPGRINLALPGTFIDLPQAIAAAHAQGMQGDIKSALLMVSQAKGKAPVAVWEIAPMNNGARFLSYFVAATDGKPLELTDFSDGIDGTDAQLKAAYDAEHPQANNSGGTGGNTGTVTSGGGYNANAAYAASQRKAYDYEMFQGDSARAANCRDHGC